MRNHKGSGTCLLFRAVLLVALVGGLLASCGPAATPTTPPVLETAAPPASTPTAVETAAPPAGPKRGGTLKWARGEIPVNLDPVSSDATLDIRIFYNIYEPLVRINFEGTGIEPALAESWDISDDGLVYIFHLRPGAKFGDGSPLRASDVVWSLRRASDPERGNWSWSLGNVEQLEALDDSTVEITLGFPASNFLSMLALFSNDILPQELVEEMGEDGFFKRPVGTGPFRVAEYVPGDYFLMEKNPYYWELGADGEPLPYLDAVKIFQVPEGSTRVMQVQGGDIDGTDEIPFSMIDELKEHPNLSMRLFPSMQQYSVFINVTKPPLDDVRVRQALNYATDQQAMVDVMLFGYGDVATSLLAKPMPCFNAELEGFPYDLQKAKQLMAESKYPDGASLTLDIESGCILGTDMATMLKEMWGEIGIEVEVEQAETSTRIQEYSDEAFTAACGCYYQWTDDILDPQAIVEYYIKSPAAHSGWHNDRTVELFEQAVVELDQQKRCEFYEAVQEIFNEEAPQIMLFGTPFTDLLQSDVMDFQQNPFGSFVWGRTWLDR